MEAHGWGRGVRLAGVGLWAELGGGEHGRGTPLVLYETEVKTRTSGL